MENNFTKPDKPFMLVGQLKNGNYMVTWHNSENDLVWSAKNNKCAIPVYALEIGTYRAIALND